MSEEQSREQPQPRPEQEQDPAPALSISVAPKGGAGARERVREAMNCPFCHDSVPRSGGALCARDGCGALYHHECWEECARDYGGCAVYGCGCTEARDLSPVGWLFRLFRLLAAAVLFPPRMVRALTRRRGMTAKEIFRQAVVEGTDYLHSVVPNLAWLLALGIMGAVISYLLIDQIPQIHRSAGLLLGIALGVPLVAIYSPFLFASGYVAWILSWRALSAAFKNELSALSGSGGGGYLSRIGRGGK